MAGGNAHELFEHPPDDPAFGISPAVGQERPDALKLRVCPPLRAAPLPGELDGLDAGAVEPDLFVRGREFLPGRVEERAGGEFLFFLGVGRDAVEQPPHPAGHVAIAAENAQGALAERLLRIRDELGCVDPVDVAQAVAGGAGAQGAIEAKQLRLGRVVAHAASGAGIAARKHKLRGLSLEGTVPFPLSPEGTVPFQFLIRHDHLAAAGLERECHRLGQPAATLLPRHEPVDDDVDRVLEELLELWGFFDAAHGAVYSGPCETLPHKVGEHVAVLPLRPPHHRRQDHHPPPRPGRQDPLHDLITRLGLEHGVAGRAVGRAHAGKEHAEEVVDLRHRRHGRTGIGARRLLGDRDRRREAGHTVDVGPRQLPEELPGEGGEALDVPPLTLGVERIEGEARLARTAHTREADEPPPRQRHRDITEVVLAGAADDDRGNGHAGTKARSQRQQRKAEGLLRPLARRGRSRCLGSHRKNRRLQE